MSKTLADVQIGDIVAILDEDGHTVGKSRVRSRTADGDIVLTDYRVFDTGGKAIGRTKHRIGLPERNCREK